MKTYMPLNGLRWSRNSGSANCDMPQSAVFGRPGGGKNEYVKIIVNTILLLGRKTLHIYAISMCMVNTVVCSIIDRLVPYYSIAIIVDVTVVLSIGVIGSKIIDKNKVTRICFSGSKK